MGDGHGRRDPAPNIERTHHGNPAWVKCCDQLIRDLVRDRLMKTALVSVGPQVQLEGLEFNAPLIRDVGDRDRRKIRLTRHRANVGELWADALDLEVASRTGVRKCLDFSRSLS